MYCPDYIIVRSCKDNQEHKHEHDYEHEHEHNIENELPHDTAAEAIMESEGFKAYIKKHGYHFTDSLATLAISAMVNADGTNHKWSVKQVMAVIASNFASFENKNKFTNGDLAYTANMAYADFFPDTVKSEADCVKYATKVAADPDGYEGIAFMRWLTDLIGKEETSIDFNKYL